MLHVHHGRLRRQDHATLHQVFQFTHIAGPTVLLQRLQRAKAVTLARPDAQCDGGAAGGCCLGRLCGPCALGPGGLHGAGLCGGHLRNLRDPDPVQEPALFKVPQPLRGPVLCVCAAVLAVALFALYQAAANLRFGLPGRAPQYTLALWIASAMLAITFALMVAFTDYFAFWPQGNAQRRG